jgi:hypothetical protein
MFVRKQAGDYHDRLRQLALDYYYRRISFLDFRTRMIGLIGSGLTEAWLSGREAVGKRTGIPFSERNVLTREIRQEISYLDGLTRAIESLIRDGKNVDVISRRLELWGDAYVRMNELSMVYNGEKQMLEWVLHPAEHCGDCVRLSGSVHSAKDWVKVGLHPKSWKLACRQGCKCTLELTDKPEGGPIW